MSARELITEHLDLWTGAVTKKSSSGRGSNGKVALTGVKKLRELILELGVRGKLVPQNPDEDPAASLIGKIATNKAELLSNEAIKNAKKLPPIVPEELPFTAPEGWHWIRLGELTQKIGSGATPRGGKSTYVDKGIPFLRSQNIWNEGLNLKNVAFITPKTHELMSNTHVYPNDILLNITGASLGRCTIFPASLEIANVSQHVTIIRTIEPLNRHYLHYLILSPYVQSMVWGRQVGMAREGLSKKVLEQFEIPVPPLEEQHRIVQKVDELMALCDRLEQQTSDQLEAHETLVDTLLGTLTQSENATELADNWARLAAHFDALFTTEQSIDKLKQSILQLAVMGRLVEQDAGEESTNNLFNRVDSEDGNKRSRLQAALQISKDAHIPRGWDYAALPEVAENKKYSIKRGPFGSALKKAYFKTSGFKVYEQQHAINNDFSRGDYYIDEEKFAELKAFEVKPGDLIISCSGTVGRVAEAPSWMEPGVINQALLKLSLDQRLLSNDYFKILFPAFFLETDTLQNLQGTAQKNMVSMETLKKEPFPMPPIEEQRRIVQKVDELMALCDQLKERLNQASKTRCQLAETVVENALH